MMTALRAAPGKSNRFANQPASPVVPLVQGLDRNRCEDARWSANPRGFKRVVG